MRYVTKHSKPGRIEQLFLRLPRSLQKPAVLGVVAIVGLAMLYSPIVLTPSGDGAATPASVSTRVAENAAQAVAPEPPAPVSKPASKPARKPKTEMVGFYVNWDDDSYRSLKQNIDTITVLMPEWYYVTPRGDVRAIDPVRQAKAERLLRSEGKHIRVMPIVNSFAPGTNAEAVAKVIDSHGGRTRLAKKIVKTMRKKGFDGVNLDFEGMTSASRGDLVAFAGTIGPMARKAKLEVSQDVIVGSATYDHARLAKNLDYLVPMMYDEHWKTSGPGPIASQGWYVKTLKKFFKQVPPKKVVVALGTYGYDWSARGGRAKSLTYPQAKAIARAEKKTIKLDNKALNSTFFYKNGRVRHRVYMLDAASAFNQVKAAAGFKPRGYAIWRLGGEDPAIWKVFAKRDSLNKDVAKSIAGKKRSVKVDGRGRIVRHTVTP